MSKLELVEAAITSATEERDVCVPSREMFRRDYDWSTETIRFINPDKLLEELAKIL